MSTGLPLEIQIPRLKRIQPNLRQYSPGSASRPASHLLQDRSNIFSIFRDDGEGREGISKLKKKKVERMDIIVNKAS